MHIEVLVGVDDLQIYPLNKPSILIGSHKSCDIVLSAVGISRRHIILSHEGDRYFVIDQGSTNGSFINEERLMPGKKVEFTAFFPLKLGGNVLITLTGDEDSRAAAMGSTARGAVPETDTQNTRTTKIDGLAQTRRRELSPRHTVQKKHQDFGRMSLVFLTAVVLLGGAYYFNQIEKESIQRTEVTEARSVGEIVKVSPAAVSSPSTETVDRLTPLSELSPKDSFTSLLKDIKCTLELEKYLCDKFQPVLGESWGVAQVGSSLDVMMDGSSFMDEARSILEALPNFRKSSGIDEVKYNENVHLLGMTLFLVNKFPKDLNYELLKDYKINFVFFKQSPDGPVVDIVASFLPAALQEYMMLANKDTISHVKRLGPAALNFSSKFYRLY